MSPVQWMKLKAALPDILNPTADGLRFYQFLLFRRQTKNILYRSSAQDSEQRLTLRSKGAIWANLSQLQFRSLTYSVTS
jgi:hypothetical protein